MRRRRSSPVEGKESGPYLRLFLELCELVRVVARGDLGLRLAQKLGDGDETSEPCKSGVYAIGYRDRSSGAGRPREPPSIAAFAPSYGAIMPFLR